MHARAGLRRGRHVLAQGKRPDLIGIKYYGADIKSIDFKRNPRRYPGFDQGPHCEAHQSMDSSFKDAEHSSLPPEIHNRICILTQKCSGIDAASTLGRRGESGPESAGEDHKKRSWKMPGKSKKRVVGLSNKIHGDPVHSPSRFQHTGSFFPAMKKHSLPADHAIMNQEIQ